MSKKATVKADASAAERDERLAAERRQATLDAEAKEKREKIEADKRAEAVARATAIKNKQPRIAAGCALTSKRGILGPGEYVSDSDFPGGRETIDKHIKTGHIIEGG